MCYSVGSQNDTPEPRGFVFYTMKNLIFERKIKPRELQKYGILAFLSLMLLVPQTANAGFKDFVLSFLGNGAEEVEAALPDALSFPVAADQEAVRTLTVVATAYSSDPNQTDDTPCAPAMWRYDLCQNYLDYGVEDTIAANFLPLGTMVRFPELYEDKVFVVRDRMNARYNYSQIGYYRIDFYKVEAGLEGTIDNVASKQEAVQFGVKRGLAMEVLPYVK